jgi:hypothetical protein
MFIFVKKSMENFVLFRTFMYSSESVVIKSLFQNENIKFYIKNDIAISAHPFASLAMGGIELYVHKDDEKKAIQLCNKFEL